MSEDIRKMIDKVKNFNQFVNESYSNSIRDLDRENKVYPNNVLVKDKFEELMNYLENDRVPMNIDRKVKYDIIWDILEYMTIYNKKVGINKPIKLTNIESIIYKNAYNLKEILHKWKKLSENPNIEPKDIFIDFKA
jgi:hypothetical protein